MIDLDDLPLSQPSSIERTKAHHLYRQRTVVSAGDLVEPRFAAMLEPLQPVRTAWLSWIEPGGYVVEHIDAGPHYERWQVPISGTGRLIQNGIPVDTVPGVPHRVRHDDWHEVDNRDAAEPRVVLVVDRDILINADRSPLRLRGE